MPNDSHRDDFVRSDQEYHVLKAHSVVRQVYRAGRASIVAAWGACKSSRLVRIAILISVIPVLCVLLVVVYINFDRSNLPDLEGFIRFEPPTMSRIYDANGHVLIALGREHREIIQYKDIPDILRQA
jgi:membrane peptidoglycan carboxypeptidase